MAIRVIAVTIAGAAGGAVGLCALRLIQDLLLRPPEMKDGQYPLMYLSMVFFGGLLWAATPVGALCHWANQDS